jgi:very-short-patch-repair endonuclease
MRLIVEVDGGQHNESVADAIRDGRLTADGFRVLRFWSNDVLGNLEGVLTAIQNELSK